MREIPKQDQQEVAVKTPKPMPVLPLNTDPAAYSTANRRAAVCPVQRLYPWLLFASTAVAATFCLAYISKPVILATPSPSQQDERAVLSAKQRSTGLRDGNTAA